MNKTRISVISTCLMVISAGIGVAAGQSSVAAAASCEDFAAPIYHRVNPKDGAQLLTVSKDEAVQAQTSYGYTVDYGVAFRAPARGNDAVVVHRLVRSSPRDAVWTYKPEEIAGLLKAGYVDSGGNFAAVSKDSTCTVPVQLLTKGGLHRQSAAPDVVAGLRKDGWQVQGVSFYAGAPEQTSTNPPTAPKPPDQPGGAGPAPKGTAGLDASGKTVPDTSYPIPGGAVVMSPSGNDSNSGTVAAPVRTLNRAVALAPSGGTIVLRGGSYRDWYHNANDNGWAAIGKALTFQAYPHEQPFFDGTDVVPGAKFSSAGAGRYSLDWNTPSFCDGKYYNRRLTDQSQSPNNGPCAHYDMTANPSNPMAMDPQMVWFDGKELEQVSDVSKLSSASFVYDWAAKKIILGQNPAGHLVEVTKRPMALVLVNKTNYTIRGIGFRRYATNEFTNMTQTAVFVGNSKSVIENVVFTENAGGGLSIYEPALGSTVRRSVFAGNGYTGIWGGTANKNVPTDLLIDSNILTHNNSAGFGEKCLASCGQAAMKLHNMRGGTVSNNLVKDNEGRAVGLWCDLNCKWMNYVSNVIIGQSANPGILDEVSDTSVIASNLIIGNKYGISVASPNDLVYNNTLVGNDVGIRVYDDPRTLGVAGWDVLGPQTSNTRIANNVVYDSTSYSVQISTMIDGKPAPSAQAAATLVTLLDYNTLSQGAAGATKTQFVYWQTAPGSVTFYRTIDSMRAERGHDQHSDYLGTDPGLFVDAGKGDYRIASGHPAAGPATPLPSKVAQVLGVGSGVSHRGALS